MCIFMRYIYYTLQPYVNILYNHMVNNMNKLIPTRNQYTDTLNDVSGDLRTTLIIRLMCETGMAREELVNLERDNLDRMHKQGIWIQKAKKIKMGSKKEFVMRSREVPLNTSLYTLLKAYMDTHTSPIIINRAKARGKHIALEPHSINRIFDEKDLIWSPHKSRHFFKAQARRWMIDNRCIDVQVIKEIMGHVLTVAEKYGGESDFDYKLEIVNGIFG